MSEKTLRVGVVGLGMIGSLHARNLTSGLIKRATLSAVCDVDPSRTAAFTEIPRFTSFSKMLDSGTVDAVVLATPHYGHTVLGVESLERGIPTLTEKPIAVHKADALRMIRAWEKRRPVFAAMFNQRTVPAYKKVKELLSAGTLGKVNRVTWIVTDWFRSHHYYGRGGWRATWAGEGGGLLVNQCPHQLDMFQWLFGMPRSVIAMCKIGKYHPIEVEDEFHAVFDFEGGATGTIISSTGEAPGSNSLEIATDLGRILVDWQRLRWQKTETSVMEFSRTTQTTMAMPNTWTIEIPVAGEAGQHAEVLGNFVDAILDGVPLIAPAAEGLNSVELANAILYSSFQRRAIDLPLDSAAYESFLQEKIAASKYRAEEIAR